MEIKFLSDLQMLPINPKNIPTLYRDAMQLQKSGKYEDALKIYSQLLTFNPNMAEVHFQVGKIFSAASQFKKATTHFFHAAKLKPETLEIWDQLVENLLLLKDRSAIKSAQDFLAKTRLPQDKKEKFAKTLGSLDQQSAVKLVDVEASKLNKLGKLFAQGKYTDVEVLARKIFLEHPTEPAVADILANSLFYQGKTAEARSLFELALKLDPTFAGANSNFGLLELETGNVERAIALFRRAIALDDKSPTPKYQLARALHKKGAYAVAEAHILKLIKQFPKELRYTHLLGNIYFDAKNFEAAEKAYAKIVSKGVKTSQSYFELGFAQNLAGKTQDALQSYNLSLELNPNNTAAIVRKSQLLQSLGEFDNAVTLLMKAIELDPTSTGGFQAYTQSQKITKDDPIIPLMKNLFEDPNTTTDVKIELGFAISKSLEDIKDYDDVFYYLETANDLEAKKLPYEIRQRVEKVEQIKVAFKGFDLQSYKGQGYTEDAPIFVCGLPRSGTTLTEQIIASHPQVSGAGEVGAISYGIAKTFRIDPILIPEIKNAKPEHILSLGRETCEFLRSFAPDAMRITDKGIMSFELLPLAQAAMPNAKFIVVRRDPRDNLLSIYKNKFADKSHRYAYDLETLGEYYNLFDDHIAFWRDLIPDQFYEIQYEDLIEDTEAETRKLIDFCGLEWDDACLRPEDATRQIKTLSVYQARQPVYKSSVKSWQRYEQHLKPMFDALKRGGNYPTDN